jgi:UDP-2,3-diacylglucosamine pyrophosphatase LpxH
MKRLWRQKSDTSPQTISAARGCCNHLQVVTAIISDLHLGMARGGDVARGGEPRERLLEAVAGADRVVILGDLLELREGRLTEVLEVARPLMEGLGHATAGRLVTIVPGNHDHHLGEPWLTRMRSRGDALGLEQEWSVGHGDGVGERLAAWMPDTEVTVAYPGLWLRPDVYVTHGHYLDVHLTVPRIESIAASAMARVTGRRDTCESVADYEAVLSPMYAFHFQLAQGLSRDRLTRGGRLSRDVWARAGDSTNGRVTGLLLGRVTIPGAVALLNAAGIGPFNATLTGEELRRAGLRAFGEVASRLGIEADHVVFGHTHRPGPLPGDDPGEWATPGGARLWNAGNWFHEPVFLDPDRPGDSPYHPGAMVLVRDEGPPEVRRLLEGVALPAT